MAIEGGAIEGWKNSGNFSFEDEEGALDIFFEMYKMQTCCRSHFKIKNVVSCKFFLICRVVFTEL